MIKKIILVAVLFSSITAFSQNWNRVDKNKPLNPGINLIESSQDSDIIKFNLNAYGLERVVTKKGESFIINSPEATSILQKGAPDIPKLTTSVLVPGDKKSSVSVIYKDYKEFTNVKIAPSKGTIYRNQDPDKIPYSYGKAYSKDQFFPDREAGLSDPYILRNKRGVTITVYPFRYNPVKKTLRIYTDITVKLKHQGVSNKNVLTSENTKLNSYDFEKIYQNHFLNYTKKKYTPLGEGNPGKILIISHGPFMDEMAPFVQWKREKGIETDIVDVSTIGNNSTNIENYIANEFNNNGINYVILVGDEQQVRTNTDLYGEDSDNQYALLAGNDSYADCFIGRISAESGADVTNQVNKVIDYERDYTANNQWIESAFGSASDEGGNGQGDDGESDEQHINNISTDLQNYGYSVTNVNQVGGTNTQITNAFNSGVSVGNYVGHGGTTSWVNTNYTNTEVNSLTNTGKYPFVFSVACINGNFKNSTCFAEAWLRANSGGNPAGALAFLASTINQSWDEPMDGQDEMNDLLVESYANNIKRTFGGISFNGMFHMIDEYANAKGPEMATTWTIFGDPSVMVRTKNPQQMTVNHSPDINVGDASFNVNCSEEGALVSLTKEVNGTTQILGTGYVSGGSANISITPFSNPGTMKVTVTAFDKVTYQQDVNVIVPSGPYFSLKNVDIDDSGANNNSVMNNGESLFLDTEIENIGVNNASGVSVDISSSSQDMTINDNSENYGNVDTTSSVLKDDAFSLTVDQGVADQTDVSVDFNITDNNSNSWNESRTFTIEAPNPDAKYVSMDDSQGTNDGVIDPGENIKLGFRLYNIGHNILSTGTCDLNIISNGTSSTGVISVNQLNVSDSLEKEFDITVSSSASSGSTLDAVLTYTAGAYSTSTNISLPIGQQIETWESNDFSNYDWENDQNYPWVIVSNNPYDGTYCLKSGDITHDQETEFMISINVISPGELSFYKKVSCEKGETDWWGNYNWYDYLSFSLDGDEKDKWDGQEAWAKETYTGIQTGNHEFKWKYLKDGYVSDNDDAAWLDNIHLPPHDQATFIKYNKGDIKKFSFNVFPNPASSNVSFEINLESDNIETKVDLIDENGRIIRSLYSGKLDKGKYNFHHSVENLAQGIYFIKLKAGDQSITEKIIISR